MLIKRFGMIAAMAMLAMLVLAPTPASARVHFGVYVGGTAYYPYYPPTYYSYPYPYAYYYGYPYTSYYVAPHRYYVHPRHYWSRPYRHYDHRR
jgi:hypothetical protein